MNKSRIGALVVALGMSLGCSNRAERAPPFQVDGGSSPTGHVSGSPDYPEGPYGTANPEVGDVVPDLTLLGYRGTGDLVTPTDELEVVTFSSLRAESARYLLVHVSSLWCATCQGEAAMLSEYTRQIIDAGGAALELLVDGEALGVDPSQEELDVWVLHNDLRVTTMIPGDEDVRRVFPDRDHVYIIDMSTMEVVWHAPGPDPERTASELGAEEILTRYLSE